MIKINLLSEVLRENKISQIKALEDALNDIGIDSKIWKNVRIYLNGYGKDIKAYIEMDNPENVCWEDIYEGCNLKVFSNANQSGKWLENRAKQIKFRIMNDIQELDSNLIKGLELSRWEDCIL